MLSYARALQLIQETVAGLRRSGMVETTAPVTAETVLMGAGSPLDSIAFVTFVTELEERLSRETNQELYLVLKDIHDFNGDAEVLPADTVARYLVKLAGG